MGVVVGDGVGVFSCVDVDTLVFTELFTIDWSLFTIFTSPVELSASLFIFFLFPINPFCFLWVGVDFLTLHAFPILTAFNILKTKVVVVKTMAKAIR